MSDSESSNSEQFFDAEDTLASLNRLNHFLRTIFPLKASFFSDPDHGFFAYWLSLPYRFNLMKELLSFNLPMSFSFWPQEEDTILSHPRLFNWFDLRNTIRMAEIGFVLLVWIWWKEFYTVGNCSKTWLKGNSLDYIDGCFLVLLLIVFFISLWHEGTETVCNWWEFEA